MTECGYHGKGLVFTGAQLGKLASTHAAECKTFTVQVHNTKGDVGLNLADICQQHVVALEGSRTLFKQRTGSCTYAGDGDVLWRNGCECINTRLRPAPQVYPQAQGRHDGNWGCHCAICVAHPGMLKSDVLMC